MEISIANNIISAKIMLAVIATDETTASIEQLSVLLRKQAHIQIGIVGKSLATNTVTIKQALKKLASKTANGVLYLVVNAKTKDELNLLKQNKDIKIVVVNTNP